MTETVAPSPSTRPTHGTRPVLVLVGVCLLAALVYLNSLGNGFALDDRHIIQANPQVHGIGALPQAVTGAYWPSGPPELGMYRPLTLATFAIDWELWDGEPMGFHLVNVLLHVAVTALTFLLLVQLGAGSAAAGAGAALFAVHPVHVEAVANIVGRGEILAALFFLAACLAYLRLRRGWATTALIALLYLLSLLSKEMGVTLPGALVLLHAARGRTVREVLASARARWRVYGGLGVALVVYFALRWANIGTLVGGGEGAWFRDTAPGTRVWTAFRVIPEYLRLMLVPLDLVPDYGPGVIVPAQSWASPLVLLGMAAALALLAVTILAWRRARLVSMGILWFAGTVFPVSGFLLSTDILVAERTLYVPSVGLALGIAGVVAALGRHAPRWLRPAAAILALLVLAAGVRTWIHNPVWHDTDSVMQHLVDRHPENYRAQWVLAQHMESRGEPRAALAHMALALRMAPGHASLRREYAQALFDLERYDLAAAQFDTARHIVPGNSAPHIQYLNSLLLDGRPGEAAAAAEEATVRFPDNMIVHHLRAQALARLGRWDQALEARQRALSFDSGSSAWAHWVNLAALHVARGDPDRADLALDSARARAPDPGTIPTRAQLEARLEADETEGIPFW